MRKSASAWVFAGGDFDVDNIDLHEVADDDIVVGVDHGIVHCLNSGLVPDIMLGDFDSIDVSVLNDGRLDHVERKSFSPRKNSSDLELALEWLCDTKVVRVVLMGVSGGRSDHHLINWMLASQERWPFVIEMIDATVHAHVVTPRHALSVPAVTGQTITLMPMPEASGVCTEGLEYALHDAHLPPGTSLGLSNVAATTTIAVSVNMGRLLVFRVKPDKMPNVR